MYIELTTPNTPIDVELLNQVCIQFSKPNPDKEIIEVLQSFANREDSWKCAIPVLQSETNPYTKHIGLKLLKDFISTQFMSLDFENRSDLRVFLWEQILKFVRTKVVPYVISMANQAYVQIMKYEWPDNYLDLIPDLIEVGKQSQELCINSFEILTILADTICDESGVTMTFERSQSMKTQFVSQFNLICDLYLYILENPSRSLLIKTAVKSFGHFTSLIEFNVLLTLPIFETVFSKLLYESNYTYDVMDIFTEYAIASSSSEEFAQYVPQLFNEIYQILYSSFAEPAAILKLDDDNRKKVARCLSTYFGFYSELIDQINEQIPVQVSFWMLNMAQYAEEEEFQFVMEFWRSITRRFFRELRKQIVTTYTLYENAISLVRRIVLSKLAKPYEFDTIQDENQNFRYKVTILSDPSSLAVIMKETLVFITYLNQEDMVTAIQESLNKIKEDQCTIEQICSVAWSIGMIADVLPSEYMDTIVLDLIQLFTILIDNTSTPATVNELQCAYIYSFSQSSKLLTKYYDILKRYITVLLNFMGVSSVEFQLLAMKCFKSVVTTCRTQFLLVQDGENVSLIQTILTSLSDILSQIPDYRIQIKIFGVLGRILKGNKNTYTQNELTNMLCHELSGKWEQIYNQADPSNPEISNLVYFILKCYSKIVVQVGESFTPILKTYLSTFLNTFVLYSQSKLNTLFVRKVKEEIVNLLQKYVGSLQPKNSFLPHLFEQCCSTFLNDYPDASVDTRVPNVLSLFSFFNWKCPDEVQIHAINIYSTIFWPTVDMIKNEYIEFYEFRQHLLTFMRSAVRSTINIILNFTEDDVDLFISTLTWLETHPQTELSESALTVLSDMIISVEQNTQPEIVELFFGRFGIRFAKDIFNLLSNPVNKGSFSGQSLALKNLLKNVIVVKSIDQLIEELMKLFPGYSDDVFRALLSNLINTTEDILKFRDYLRDFIVQIKCYNPNDPALHQLEFLIERQANVIDRNSIPGLNEKVEDENLVETQLKEIDSIFSSIQF